MNDECKDNYQIAEHWNYVWLNLDFIKYIILMIIVWT